MFRFWSRRPIQTRSWCVLFVPAPLPGAVFRRIERLHTPTKPAFSRARAKAPTPNAAVPLPRSLLLSGPPTPPPDPWRVLRTNPSEPVTDLAFFNAIGPELSRTLSPRVHLLQISNEPAGAWEFATWENGDETERGGDRGDSTTETNRENRPATFLQRVSYFLRPVAVPSVPVEAIVWARKRGLPLAALLGLQSSKPGRVVDYETVAGLERKNLLLESEPVWYRFEVGLSPHPPPRSGKGESA